MLSANNTDGAPRPAVEALLNEAHSTFEQLQQRHAILVRNGFGRDDLPNETVLMCFALLGDRDREQVAATVGQSWQTLRAKGLVHGMVTAMGTAELRLMAHVIPFTHIINDLWDRLDQTARDGAPPPPETFVCPAQVNGQWGQPASLHFTTRDVAHLLLVPDAIFGLQPTLIAIPHMPDHCAGSFTIPIDNGVVTVAGIANSGVAFRHRIQFAVGEAVQ